MDELWGHNTHLVECSIPDKTIIHLYMYISFMAWASTNF